MNTLSLFLLMKLVFYKFVKILVHFHVIQELILFIYVKLNGNNGDNGDNDDNGDHGKN